MCSKTCFSACSYIIFESSNNSFYPLRCGHCKQFVPEYEKIAQALKENDPPIPVVKVDATVATEVAGRFEVQGYPTIKILKNGEPVDYDGDRTEKGKNSSQPFNPKPIMFFEKHEH